MTNDARSGILDAGYSRELLISLRQLALGLVAVLERELNKRELDPRPTTKEIRDAYYADRQPTEEGDAGLSTTA